MKTSQDFTGEFLNRSISYLEADFFPRIQHCVEELSEQEIWWKPNRHSNSVGNLLLHLEGNVRQWIVSGIGQMPDTRRRDLEFSETGPLTKEDLLLNLRGTLDEAESILRGLKAEQLLESRHIQIYDVTVLEAVYHVVEHFSHHTGQILYVTKLLLDRDLHFYKGL